MNLDVYKFAIREVELILRGIREKVNAISKDDWKNMKMGGHVPFKNEDEEIGWNQMIAIEEWIFNEKKQGVELLFSGIRIAEKRVKSVMEYLKKQEDVSTLELICYASFVLMYFSMRNFDVKKINKLTSIIYHGLWELNITENEKKYLEKILEIVFRKMMYVYNYVELKHKCKWERLEEEKYNKDIQELLEEAFVINSNGKIIELFKEIKMVEQCFKNPSMENIEKIRKECFLKKENWVYHIFTYSSPERLEVNSISMRYLPYIKFCTSSDPDCLMMEEILRDEPKGYWKGGKKYFLQTMDEWKKEAYWKIFSLPHEVHIKQSQGALIYNMLDLLAENKELEDTKNAMVSDFTHRYKNYEIDNVYNIANALTSHPSNEELEDFSRELLLEYYNKQMMSREIAMLSLEHKDSFEELRKVIKESIATTGKGVTIEKIVNEALKRVLLRILLIADEERMENIRQKYEEKGIDTWDLLEKYEIDILKEEINCVEWVNRYMNSLIVEISNEWKKLNFKSSSEGSVFLMSLLMELLLNMFTYTDISDDMNVKFVTRCIGGTFYFIIETRNKVDYKIKRNGRKGLASRNRILSKINYGQDYKWCDSILKEYSEDELECMVTARICSDLFGGCNEENNSLG